MTGPRAAREWAAKCRFFREAADLSREELATKMGVVSSAVRHWERGDAKPRDLERFARSCKIDVARLFEPLPTPWPAATRRRKAAAR